MNQRTDVTENRDPQREREFSPDFVRLLVALTGATLLIVFLFEYQVVGIPRQPVLRFYLHPWIVAAGYTIAKGLAEFSGHAPAVIGGPERVAALLGLLFAFVIGPTLFFFGWYGRRKDRAAGTKNPSLKGSGVISIIGGILTFAIAIPSIPIAVVQMSVSSDLRQAQAVQSNKDAMINEMNIIAHNAAQYRILPKTLGGGNGSFDGYVIPQALASTEEGAYMVVVAADAFTLNASSKKYDDCTISTHVNSQGEFDAGVWKYGGRFQ